MTQDKQPRTPTRPTPEVDRLLDRLSSRLTSNVYLHGLSTALAFAALWLLAAFLLDWALHLPSPVRLFHLGILTAIPAYFLWRDLVRPLTSRPDRVGLAVLVERAHPGLHEVLSSAVELSRSERPSGAPDIVDAVVREAERKAGQVGLERVLDPRGPRRRGLLALAASGLVAAVFVVFWGSASVFLARLAGADVPWPQRTHLALEIPAGLRGAAPLEAPLPDSSGETTYKVARGSDVPIVVRADGVVPDEVTLHFSTGHQVVLAAGGGNEFRALLPSVQDDQTLYATGGDDQDERPSVRLVVLQPPDVAGLAVAITPPSYTHLQSRLEFDRDVEVVAGSQVVVHVATTPPGATGKARVVPEDRLIDLVPAPFPSDPNAPGDAVPKAGLAFQLEPQKSLRYRFELIDSTGLSNPDPGLFGVSVIEDRAPEVELLSPGRGDFDTVLGGLIPLRARAEDDFGIATVSYTTEVVGAEVPPVTTPLPFEALALESPSTADAPRPARASVVRAAVLAHARLEVSALGGAEPVGEGRQFQLQVVAADVCEPEAHPGKSSPLRVRVVSTDEFMRRLQDRLARCQTSAAALSELVREKHRRLGDLLATLESDSPEGANGEIGIALTGARRVLGDARALMRELCANAESVLYARLDERALGALDLLDERTARARGRGFDPEPWRELGAASRANAVAGTGLAGKLVDIGVLSLEISEDLAASAVDSISKAGEAVDLKKAHEELQQAAAAGTAMLEKIDLLLERLAEWDNFQSVLSLTRDILNAQKSVSERTRAAAKEK